jgi:uncharacterized protein YukE
MSNRTTADFIKRQILIKPLEDEKMNDNIQINVAQAEGNIQTLTESADRLEEIIIQINELVNNLDHWQGDAKNSFIMQYMEISPKLRACVDFTRDQARVVREVKEAFQGIRIV